MLVVIAITVVLDREVRDRIARADVDLPAQCGRARRDRRRRSADLSTIRRWAGVGATVALVAALAGSFLHGDGSEATLSGWLVPVDDGTYALACAPVPRCCPPSPSPWGRWPTAESMRRVSRPVDWYASA